MSDVPIQKPVVIRVACPACRTVYEIKKGLLGKKLICAKCKVAWTAIAPETLQAAKDQVCEVEAELMDNPSDLEKTATLVSPTPLPVDYWLGKNIGRYKIRSILGTGAVGHVYRGHDSELSRDVALKILPKKRGEKMTLREKLFLQEARAAARLQHPNIVTVFEVGIDGEFYFFAMEVVDGGTLKDLTLALNRLSPARACFLIGQAAQALAYAHANGVVHRDVKPDNLMMDRLGVLKVADFGLAEIGEVDLFKLYKNRPIGTPGYISPEMARGEGAGASGDIYCLGLCLYHSLTGHKYLQAGNMNDLISLCANPPRFEPGARLSHVPGECLRILAKCLEPEPANRYASAQDLADELRRFVVDTSRDDSQSPLLGSGLDPVTSQLERPPRSRLSSMFSRAGRIFRKRREPKPTKPN